jgi:hypothetical protein
MTKPEQTVSKNADGMGDISAITKQSFDAMSGAFSTWLRDANRFQAEAIRFLNDRFNKDIQMMSQFATCKKPEEIFELQAKLANSLVSDYMAEGTKVLELFGDVVKAEVEDFSKTLSAKH